MSKLASLNRLFCVRYRATDLANHFRTTTYLSASHRSLSTSHSLPSTVPQLRRSSLAFFAHRARTATQLPITSVRYCSHRRNMCLRDDVSGSSTAPKREVLPTNVKPTHYDLTLEPDLEKFTYTGEVTIEYVNIQPVGYVPADMIQSRRQSRHYLNRPQHQ